MALSARRLRSSPRPPPAPSPPLPARCSALLCEDRLASSTRTNSYVHGTTPTKAVNVAGLSVFGEKWGRKGNALKGPGAAATHGRKASTSTVYYSTEPGKTSDCAVLPFCVELSRRLPGPPQIAEGVARARLSGFQPGLLRPKTRTGNGRLSGRPPSSFVAAG